MSETPTRSRASRKSNRNLDLDFKPNVTIHVVQTPLKTIAASPAPQSPAFATRSRVKIDESVLKLTDQLLSAKKKFKTSTKKPSKQTNSKDTDIETEDDEEEDAQKQDVMSQQSLLAEPLPSSQEPMLMMSPNNALILCKELISTENADEPKDESSKPTDGEDKDVPNLMVNDDIELEKGSADDPAEENARTLNEKGYLGSLTTEDINTNVENEESQEEEEDDLLSSGLAVLSQEKHQEKGADDTASDECTVEKDWDLNDGGADYYCSDDNAGGSQNKTLVPESADEEGSDQSFDQYVEDMKDDEKLSSSCPRVMLEKIKIPESSSSCETRQNTPRQLKKRRSKSLTPSSAAKKNYLKNLMDNSLKIISMEINAVVGTEDQRVANIKIKRGGAVASPMRLSLTKASPISEKKLLSSTERKQKQQKAMFNWSVTDTDESESFDESKLGKVKTSVQKEKKHGRESPVKLPDESTLEERENPSSPTKLKRIKQKVEDIEVDSPRKNAETKIQEPSSPSKSLKKGQKSDEVFGKGVPVKSPEKRIEAEKFTSPSKSPKKRRKEKKSIVGDAELMEGEEEERSDSIMEVDVAADTKPQEVDECGSPKKRKAKSKKEVEKDEDNVMLMDVKENEKPIKVQESKGHESDDSEDAPEEVSVQTSKISVEQLIQKEIEAIQLIKLAKKEKNKKRKEKRKLESKAAKAGELGEEEIVLKAKKKKKRDKLAREGKIQDELQKKEEEKKVEENETEWAAQKKIPDSILEELETLDKLGESKKKTKKKKKNKYKVHEEEQVKPKKTKFSEDFIPLEVEGPTNFGLVPLDESSMRGFVSAKEARKWKQQFSIGKNTKIDVNKSKKLQAKLKAQGHSIPKGFKGDQHFF
ncbi:nucleolar and coiled-body phosphoprotein 1-like isoform X2 [Neocloeon triangulifer]|uniref:nucleolar and coiled-body phosphoprotein 1-like isoform X2 n=1 Tax=Neocloeon triangulifer TaxID=2078957 RepID=UPI00286EFF95|nr:nucleolar and coiled-body phosphoprotein 1-like isoform X2 [Neocloeon triangulifer]